jgi:hypothetical protein
MCSSTKKFKRKVGAPACSTSNVAPSLLERRVLFDRAPVLYIDSKQAFVCKEVDLDEYIGSHLREK